MEDVSSQDNSWRSNVRQWPQEGFRTSEFENRPKEESLDSASISPIYEQRKEISVPQKKRKIFRTESSLSGIDATKNDSFLNENESSEEIVELAPVSHSGEASLAGPSGLQTRPFRTSESKRFLSDGPICGTPFRYGIGLDHTRRAYPGETSYVCDIRYKGFGPEWSKHQLNHPEKTPFEFSIRHKTFGQNDILQSVLLTHLDGKPFVCSICGRGFIWDHNLKRHLLTHADEKPFLCSICGREFTRKDDLQVHLQTHSDGKNL